MVWDWWSAAADSTQRNSAAALPRCVRQTVSSGGLSDARFRGGRLPLLSQVLRIKPSQES